MPNKNEPQIKDVKDLNGQLVLAIVKKHLKAIHTIMAHGSPDLFIAPAHCAIVKTEPKISAFKWAMNLQDDEIINILLSESKTIFDLSKPIADIPNKPPMNWIQDAIINSSPAVASTLIEYQLKNFPQTDIFKVINKHFYHEMPGRGTVRTNIMEVLVWSTSNMSFAANISFSDCDDLDSATDFMQEWLGAPEYKTITKLPPENLKLHICPVKQLKFLLENNYLSQNLCDSRGRSLIALLNDLIRYSKDAQLWEKHARPNIIYKGVKPIGPAIIDSTRRVEIPIAFERLCPGAEPLITVDAPVYEALLIHVDPDYAASLGKQATSAMTALEKKITKRVDRVETTAIRAESKADQALSRLSKLPDDQYNMSIETLASLPFHQAVFKRLYLAITPNINLKRDSHLGVYKTNHTNKNLQMTSNVLSIVGVYANLAPVPYVALVPALISGAVTMANEYDKVRKEKDAFDKFQDDGRIFALSICQILVNETVKTYGEKPTGLDYKAVADALAKKVKSQINNVYKLKTEATMHVVAFLCVEALNELLLVQGETPIKTQSNNNLLFGCFGSSNAVYTANKALMPNQYTGSTSSSDRGASGEKVEIEHYAAISNGSLASTPPRMQYRG